MAAATSTGSEDLEIAMRLIFELSGRIGARRPTGHGERRAAEHLADRLRRSGIAVEVEDFAGYPSFAEPFGILMGLAVAPGLLPRRLRRTRVVLAMLAAAGLFSEGSLLRTPLSAALARRRSQNVVGSIEPTGRAERTLCLMAHVDTSRSGLIFHPRLVRWMPGWIAATSVLVGVCAMLEPFAGRSRTARRILAAARGAVVASLGLLAERELRGVDVPGANDNASGCGVAVALAARIADQPLASTRVVTLLTGCEEAGTLGARAFRDAHDTGGWLFLNFDNVGGPGSVRYLRREGVIARWNADQRMVSAAARVAAARPDLRMAPEDRPAGLTYDSSPFHASGDRALTISVQDGAIPNLHRPTDVHENVEPDGVSRTLAAGAELIAAIDRGDAD